jgi:hypothetical protein
VSTSDVMHISADREAAIHHHTVPRRHQTPPRGGSGGHPSVRSVGGGSSSILSSRSAAREERDVHASDEEAWQQPRQHVPSPAQQQIYHTSQSSLTRGESYSDGDVEPREGLLASSAIGHMMHHHHSHRNIGQGPTHRQSRRSLRSGVEFEASQADEMSEVLGPYDEFAHDFEEGFSDDDEGEEIYRRGGVLDAGSTMTSNPSTGSLLFTGTIASVKGQSFCRTYKTVLSCWCLIIVAFG